MARHAPPKVWSSLRHSAVTVHVSSPHEMLISDQCAIDGLLFSRRTPFVGLFGTPQTATGAILELHTLIAIVIYALIAWLVVRGAGLMLGEGRSASVARTDNVQTRAR